MLNIAIRAARAAGSLMVRYVDRLDSLNVQQKSPNDFVSDIDRMAEQAIIEVIRRSYPDHEILAEESGSSGSSEFQWIIDPVDGTTNYLHGIPHYCVSIALMHRNVLDQGVVFNPISQELFTATRGAGAQLDGKRIRATNRKGLEQAVLGTGFAYRELRNLDTFMGSLGAVIPKTAGVRRSGSAALDLAYVACGRYDGFWQFGLEPWDMAAGALLVREAGGIVNDCDGSADFMRSGNIIAAGSRVSAELCAQIKPFAVTHK